MATVKPKGSSNNLPIVITLILIPVFFIFSVFLIFILVNSRNKIDNKDIVVTLLEPKSLTRNEAIFALTTSGDQSKIIEKGFVYDTNPEPSLEPKKTNTSPLTEIFGSNYNTSSSRKAVLIGDETVIPIYDLYDSSRIYVRAYVKTQNNAIYSKELSFIPGEDEVRKLPIPCGNSTEFPQEGVGCTPPTPF